MIFIKNKYTTWYYNIINNAKARDIIEGYTEKHHIIPKSLSGDNSEDNLVTLTAREHFICHWLLTKMTTNLNKSKMFFALNMMKVGRKKYQIYTTKITSRIYMRVRKELATANLNLWNNKTPKQKEEHAKKAAISTKKVWEDRTQEEKSSLRKKMSRTWKNKSQKEKNAYAQKQARKTLEVWKNKPQEEKENHALKTANIQKNRTQKEKDIISKKLSDGWHNRSQEEKDNIIKKRIDTHTNKSQSEKKAIIQKRLNTVNAKSLEEKAAFSSKMRDIQLNKTPAEKEIFANSVSLVHKGRRWYTNGTIRKKCFPGTEPDGFILGKKLFNI